MKPAFLPQLFLLLALLACGGPGGAEGRNHAGVQHFEAGRVEEAIAEYAEAIRLDPQFAAAYYNRGQAYFALGQSQRAIPDFDEAIRINPDDPQVAFAYVGRAMAHTLLGNDAEAKRDIARAVEGGYDPRRLVAMIDELKKQR